MSGAERRGWTDGEISEMVGAGLAVIFARGGEAIEAMQDMQA